MSAWDEICEKSAELRKRSGNTLSEAEALAEAGRMHGDLYRRYVSEQKRGVVSQREQQVQDAADTLRKRVEPNVSTATGALTMLVDDLVRKGMSRPAATERVCKSHPDLYHEHVAAIAGRA